MIPYIGYSFFLSLGYLLGSIPFGLVLCKIYGAGDIREVGSGNIGATNVLRTGNKTLALATLLLDSSKGAIAVFATAYISYLAATLTNQSPNNNFVLTTHITLTAGLGAVIGHCYPIWLKFKGGKGVATTLGTLLALAWPVGLSACVIWFISALIFRISSLSALIAVGLTPLIAHYITGNQNLSIVCAIIAAIVFLKHRDNIKRLLKGEEPKIGKKKKDTDKEATK